MKRPLGVTVLAILAVLGAVAAIIHTLQMLNLWPIMVGPLKFFTFEPLGALLWAILAAIYIWLVIRLWNVDPQAWLFLVILSILNLVMAVVSIFGGMNLQDMAAAIIVNAVVLLYCLLPSTKEAFGADSLRVEAPPAAGPQEEATPEE